MTKKIIFITGATGFLGKEIIPYLLTNGYTVKALTRNASNYKNTDELTYLEGNILDSKLIEKELKECYGLIHVAGEKEDISKMQSINVEGTKTICDIANQSGLKYFCHVSSVGVIGSTEKKYIDESTVCKPINIYEKTKLEAENYVLNNFNLANCSSVIVRPTNIFGKTQLEFCQSITAKIKRWIKGNEVSNYIYVKNVAASCVHFLTQTHSYKNDIFIVNDEDPINKFKHIYQIATGKKEFVFYAPVLLPWFLRLFKFSKNNLGNKVYSNKKLLATGLNFSFTLKSGINDALK
jgi:nucleoside-diphosphate-sugar epimerase